MADPFTFTPGEGPLLISVPHAGLDIPEDLKPGYTKVGLSGKDADHFVDRLYDFSPAAKLVGTQSRYVLDLNRAPDDTDLYPGQFTTGLFPLVSFEKEPLYKEDKAPDAAEKARRIAEIHAPYHRKLAAVLADKKKTFGRALLWEAHSIKSQVPSLFEGRLPDFNFGTNGGASCSLPVEPAFSAVMRGFPDYSFVFNGRFKGGWTTRHYGRPEEGVHALQLELSKATYMNEESGAFEAGQAKKVQAVLSRLIEVFQTLA